MDKKLLRSVREYKKQSFLTPVLCSRGSVCGSSHSAFDGEDY